MCAFVFCLSLLLREQHLILGEPSVSVAGLMGRTALSALSHYCHLLFFTPSPQKCTNSLPQTLNTNLRGQVKQPKDGNWLCVSSERELKRSNSWKIQENLLYVETGLLLQRQKCSHWGGSDGLLQTFSLLRQEGFGYPSYPTFMLFCIQSSAWRVGMLKQHRWG